MGWRALALAAALSVSAHHALAQAEPGLRWKTAWAASVQGPYPVGNPSAQPDQRFAFPDPSRGARDQTFRLIVRPSIWGEQARFRVSNVLGTKPLSVAAAHVGVQFQSAALLPGLNKPATFAGKPSVEVPPGESVWSDPVDLGLSGVATTRAWLGRKLAVSLHVAGESGPMTWHAKALQTSYVSQPGSGPRGAEEGEAGFPYATSSWFFLDAVDMTAPDNTPVVVAFGDSITDGTASVMNGDDRWPDVLSRRFALDYGPNFVSVVNAGIGGNQVAGPPRYGPAEPFPGGPSAVSRLPRDVLALSGVRTVVWLEGINDFSRNGNASVEAVTAAMREGARMLRDAGIRVVGATVVPALNSTSPAHGFPEQDEKRKALNEFIRSSGVFDAVIDFDAVARDPETGRLRPEFVPDSTAGGPGDKLHPNRTGYLAMAGSIDLSVLVPRLPR